MVSTNNHIQPLDHLCNLPSFRNILLKIHFVSWWYICCNIFFYEGLGQSLLWRMGGRIFERICFYGNLFFNPGYNLLPYTLVINGQRGIFPIPKSLPGTRAVFWKCGNVVLVTHDARKSKEDVKDGNLTLYMRLGGYSGHSGYSGFRDI